VVGWHTANSRTGDARGYIVIAPEYIEDRQTDYTIAQRRIKW